MIELSVSNVTKYYGANKIFQNITFDIKTGERVGLIGQNGCGKTSIMKMIMGLESFEEGEIAIRKDATVGYLNQIPVFSEGTKVIDVIELAFDDLHKIKKEMENLESKFLLLQGEDLDKALAKYGRLCEKYELLGGYEIESKISKIIEGLKISETMINTEFEKLSGGEKTRVILAKILLEAPDILLLDEPSNHLDLESIQWLEEFLKEYKGSILVVSHDRYFLDRVVGKIVELEFNRANIYLGNYSYYTFEKERRFWLEYRAYQNQQQKIERMERQIQRYRIWGAMRDSEKMYRKAKELEKRLEKIEVLERPKKDNRKIRLGETKVQRSGKFVLQLKGIYKGYEGLSLLEDITFDLFYQDSACIIGKNGCGKTTLLKMIVGEVECDEGIIKIGSNVKIGYLPQNVKFKDEEQTVLEYFSREHNLSLGEARAQLAKALFVKDDVHKKIKSLSGGERSRLKLYGLTYEGVNFMILDEPTNHLDMDSREVLEQTLINFEGTLLFVSHDRYFIDQVADRIISIEDKDIKIYEGNYEDYAESLKKR